MKINSRLRERLREATCEAILEAAEEVIAEEGLHTARVESIAQRAGTAVGTLYTHFKDRDGLMTALLEARRYDLSRCLDQALERVDGQPFEQQLREAIRALFGQFEAHRPFFSILMQGELGGGVPRAASSTQNARSTFLELLERLAVLTGRGVEAGALRPELAELYPHLLLGMVRSLFKRDLLEARGGALENTIDPLVEFFMEGGGSRRE